MIYAASLGSIVKKSQQSKAFTTTIDRIVSQMQLDPEVSGLDAVILGPKDVMGINTAKVQGAVNSKHPDVCVIYLYTKDNEASLVSCEYTQQVKKLDDKAIDDAVTTFLSSHLIKAGKLEMTSKDTIAGKGTAIAPPPPVQEPEPDPDPEPEPVSEVPPFGFNLPEEPAADAEPDPAPAPDPEPFIPVPKETTDMLEHIRDFGDFDLLKKQLTRDSVIAEVLAENANFMHVQQMLEMLDGNIKTIFLDTSLSSEERYRRTQELGMQRSAFKGQANNAIVEKTISIFDKVTTIVDEFVRKKVGDIEASLTKVTVDKESIQNGTVNIENLIVERTKMEVELMELLRNVLDVYKSMDSLTSEEVTKLDDELPSTNDFVNSVLEPSKQLFTPANTSALCSSLMTSLQNGRITVSAMESRIKAVIGVIFKICEQNDMIIKYQASLIKLLKANKVEDIVVVETMLKGALRLYVGAEDTGSTATILTQSGLQSRASNTLVVDLSGNGKWEDYGVTPYSWDEFVSTNPHENLCVVTAKADDPEQVHEVVREITKALDHYRYVNVKLDYTQTQVMSQICDDAIVVHFISDCRASNVRKMKEAVGAVWSTNIAKKVILIDAPTNDILSIVTALGCDILTTKVISIPHMTDVKGCAITRKLPHLNENVAKTFEGAFR